MEEFYRNPFRRELDFNEFCYASVQSYSGDNPSSYPAGVGISDNFKESELLGVSSALRYQTQLSEALRANSTLRATYEAHIDVQRKEMERFSDENNKLVNKLTRLETDLRSLVLEKECAALAYKREIEKNATLEGKIRSLEAELNSLEQRTRELSAAYNGNSHRSDTPSTHPQNRTPSHYNYPQHHSHQQEFTPSHEKNTLLFTPEPLRYGSQRRDRNYDGYAGSNSNNSSIHTGTPVGPRRTEQVADVSDHYGRRTQGNNHNHHNNGNNNGNNVSGGSNSGNSGGGNRTTNNTQRTDEARTANIKQLEQQLTRECQTKEQIERELQKMESTRVRSGSDRAKKISLERALAAAQQAVGETRMKLRGLSALVR